MQELGHQSSDCRPKYLNLLEVAISEVEADNIENGDNEKALELEADEGKMLNCIGEKILLALKF